MTARPSNPTYIVVENVDAIADAVVAKQAEDAVTPLPVVVENLPSTQAVSVPNPLPVSIVSVPSHPVTVTSVPSTPLQIYQVEVAAGVYAVPKFFTISASGILNATVPLIAAVSGKRIRILSLVVQSTTLNLTFHFRSGSTPISGTFSLQLAAAFQFPECVFGLLQTGVAEAFNVNFNAAGSIVGFGTYVEV